MSTLVSSLSLSADAVPPGLVLAVLAALVLIPFIWFIATYNVLVRLRNYCRESWAVVDTELKRRYDLIPNLVQTAQGYATHEREVFETVARSRAQAQAASGSPAQQAVAENAFVGGLRSLLAVVENYPDLKASGNFLKLQEELANTEDRIQAARRFFNANVRDYNTRLEVIPSNLVAGMFSFRPQEFFEIEAACERAAPVAKF